MGIPLLLPEIETHQPKYTFSIYPICAQIYDEQECAPKSSSLTWHFFILYWYPGHDIPDRFFDSSKGIKKVQTGRSAKRNLSLSQQLILWFLRDTLRKSNLPLVFMWVNFGIKAGREHAEASKVECDILQRELHSPGGETRAKPSQGKSWSDICQNKTWQLPVQDTFTPWKRGFDFWLQLFFKWLWISLGICIIIYDWKQTGPQTQYDSGVKEE